MTPRQRFDEKLDQIRSDVVRMGNLASDMAQQAVEAMQNNDPTLARQVILADDEVDRLEQDTIRACVTIVMQEAPVANDLRMLTSTLGVIGEIEKVADDAVKLARRATKLGGQFPGELRMALHEMGKQARSGFASALRLYTNYTPELAKEVIDFDEVVDKSYSDARKRAVELIQQNPDQAKSLVRTIDAFHALEHIADRAVAIAKRLKVHYESGEPVSREG
jgi:phosphate transport system protein